MLKGIFNALRRIGVAIGWWAESSTHNEAVDEAIIQRSIQTQQERANVANTANGKLKATIILLGQQIREEEIKTQQLTAQLEDAARRNDVEMGGPLAEQLEALETELATNREQHKQLEEVYQQNLEIIANSLQETQKLQREFQRLQAQAKTSQVTQQVAEQLKSSISQLQGMNEAGQAIQRLKQRTAAGQGELTATVDLANKMGASIAQTQSAQKARGRALFEQFKSRQNMTNPEVAVAAPAATEAEERPAERQKIAEG